MIIDRPHTHAHKHSDRKSLYLYEPRLHLFVSTPINPAVESPRHRLPILNSWAAGLLAAVVWSNFQSVPPQRKRSLTPATQHQQRSPWRHRSYTGSRLRTACSSGSLRALQWWLEMGMSVCGGAGFLCGESSLRTEWRSFYNAAGVESDREHWMDAWRASKATSCRIKRSTRTKTEDI